MFEDDAADGAGETKWPDKIRKAFGPGPGRRTAALSWVLSREQPLEGYITGYKIAAEEVFAATATKGHSPERMLFPLAFLWRHFTEVALKDIIAVGRLLENEDWTYPQGHRLLDLWTVARPYVVACGSEDSPELAIVERQIREFENVDPFASGFRYPLGKKGGSNLPGAPSHVDLDQFQDAMVRLAEFLECVRMEQSARLDYIRTYYAEMLLEQDR